MIINRKKDDKNKFKKWVSSHLKLKYMIYNFISI